MFSASPILILKIPKDLYSFMTWNVLSVDSFINRFIFNFIRFTINQNLQYIFLAN